MQRQLRSRRIRVLTYADALMLSGEERHYSRMHTNLLFVLPDVAP